MVFHDGWLAETHLPPVAVSFAASVYINSEGDGVRGEGEAPAFTADPGDELDSFAFLRDQSSGC